ncbi:MAG TPA: RNA 3'-terminal phosphate cyclase [Thermodesulfovibrionia bacterium]|nr:RNA 3'-terminal phosphate cyclase [Thermodesulfovibrionia bacterium]
MEEKALVIDGSEKSGSGTILRYSLVIASLLRKPLKISNVRAKRSRPGLMPQHLKTAQACVDMTGAQAEGLYKGSQALTYSTGSAINGGRFFWDIGTAGSTTLMAQCLVPLAFFAKEPSVLTLNGGLFQDFAPNPFHMKYVLFPLLEKFSLSAQVEVIKPGYYPKGGGSIQVTVQPVAGQLTPITLLEQGQVVAVKGIAIASHLKQGQVSQRMAEACSNQLAKKGYTAEIECIDDTTANQKGAALIVYAITDTGCIIAADMAGKIGVRSEQIGKTAALQLLDDLQTGAAVDRFIADQLILYAALADGESAWLVPSVTEHVESNLWLVSHLLGASALIKGQEIRIQGIGMTGNGAA